MSEAAAAERLMHHRIEFHATTKPSAAVDVAGGFPMKRFFVDAGKRVAAAAPARSEDEGRSFEKGESSGTGFDPELSAARIYLRRIGAGLHNPGNTCYLNSVLQCLTYTEPFVAYLQSGNHKSLCRTAGFCALCALQSHVRSALQSTGKILTPLQFIKNLRSISRSFSHYRQEDAHELMVNLLESMHKCCLPSGVPSESPSAYEKSLVHRIFGGRLRSQVKCAWCLHCSNKFDPFLDLSLEIGNAATLVKALHNFTKEELLDGGEKNYNCQHCKQKVVATKRFTIDKAPSVLTIHLKRFSPFNPLQKIDKKVDFQTTLNLKPFVSDSEAMDLKYSLYGVLVHAGWNTQFGHYYCFVQTSSGIWHNLDDNKVRQVREGDVLGQKAYMLFYVRDRSRSPIMHKNDGAASLSSNKKMIPEKIVCMDGTIHNGLVESATKVSSFASDDAKLQKQNQPRNICNRSQNQCSNAHNKTEFTDASTSQNNVPTSVQITPFEDQCSNAYNKTEVTDASTSKNNMPDSVEETQLRDLCSHVHEKSEVIDASRSHNNEPASVQKAPFTNPNGVATISTITKQINSDSQREMMPPGQHDICILHTASCDQKACKEPLQELQLKCDGSLTDLGKNVAVAAHPICNGADGLLGANDQATEPQPDPFCEPISDNDTEAIAQIIPTEDAAVSNQSVSKSTSGNVAKETEAINQHDELVVVKELSAKNINDEENEEGQTLVLDKAVQEGQPLVNELSVMNIDHVAVAEEQTSVQNHSLDSGQVSSKKICSEDSSQMVCSEDCAQVICPENSLLVLNKEPCHGNSHRDMAIKSKKHVKYPVVNLFFGSKQLLLGSLKPRKKRKHKRIKRRLRSSMDAESIASDQQASTSETAYAEGTSCKSRRRKHSRNAASSEDGIQFCNKKQNLGCSKQDSKDAALSSIELARSGPNSIGNPDSGKCAPRNEKGSSHFDLLTRGLRHITVPRWDDNDLPDTTETKLQHSSSTGIGYVLDERDEEYDRGKRIKDFCGPNPFQETANISSWQRIRLKSDQARCGNQPHRI